MYVNHNYTQVDLQLQRPLQILLLKIVENFHIEEQLNQV